MNTAIENISIPSIPLKNSRKPRIPFALRAIQWIFPRVEAIAPSLANRWFIKLFFSPVKYPVPPSEREILQRAERFSFTTHGKKVQVYAWGEGPVILLMHGWSGRATQFKSFIPSFTSAGFKVIALDAPAHGNSSGSRTNIFEFKDAILKVQELSGEIAVIVAHSIGGTAAVFALTEGLNVSAIVTVSTPTVGDEIIKEFASRLGATENAARHLREFIHTSFKRSFDELTAAHFARQLPGVIDWLIIHDEQDREAPVQNARTLQDAYPHADLLITTGLGHVRILRDERVINEILGFIRQRVPRS